MGILRSKKDPNELINQYYIPENDSIVTALKAELARLRTELDTDADPSPANLPTVTLQKWITPLKLGGCTDSNYVEYNPEADSSIVGACQTVGVVAEKSKIKGLKLKFNIEDRQVVFDGTNVAGNLSVSIRKTNGVLLEEVKETSNQFIWDASDVNPGMYIIQVQVGKKFEYFKFLR